MGILPRFLGRETELSVTLLPLWGLKNWAGLLWLRSTACNLSEYFTTFLCLQEKQVTIYPLLNLEYQRTKYSCWACLVKACRAAGQKHKVHPKQLLKCDDAKATNLHCSGIHPRGKYNAEVLVGVVCNTRKSNNADTWMKPIAHNDPDRTLLFYLHGRTIEIRDMHSHWWSTSQT